MGHYRAEMICDTCQQMRCTCPRKPDPSEKHWVISDDYQIMTALDFQTANNESGMGFWRRMTRSQFKSKKAAHAHALVQVQEATDSAHAALAELTTINAKLRANPQ